MFTLRFDMRAPAWAGPAAGLYAAAINMCAWAETHGAVLAVLSEHHGADDGHLPVPLMLSSAIAARTNSLAILLAAVPIPLWDPVRLAEEISVLDLISRGRVSYAFGVGHRPEEYEHFSVEMATRGRAADEALAVLGPLVRGEPVEYRGRTVRVTPPCHSPRGPMVLIAGGSRAAARRAARHGLGFISQAASPGLKEYYEAQRRAHGHEPGIVQFPQPGSPTAVFVADDVDEAWDELGPHLLHDAKTAASYRPQDDSVASITRADSVAALREGSNGGGPYRIVTPDEPTDYVRGGQLLPLHPLCGGVAPDVAWPYLERAAAAAGRAGRYGLGMLGNANAPGIQEACEAACREHRHEPGPTMSPGRDTPSVVFVADDVDAAWKELGEHLLHDVRMYAAWNPGDETTAGFSHVDTVDELRETGTSHVIISVPEAISRVKAGQVLNLSPLCGGLPPEVAWPYLKRVGEVVLPEASR